MRNLCHTFMVVVSLVYLGLAVSSDIGPARDVFFFEFSDMDSGICGCERN